MKDNGEHRYVWAIVIDREDTRKVKFDEQTDYVVAATIERVLKICQAVKGYEGVKSINRLHELSYVDLAPVDAEKSKFWKETE